MSDLIKDYFKRDLSPAEERRLLAALKSEEAALRFSGEAGKTYARLAPSQFWMAFSAALAHLRGAASGMAGLWRGPALRAALASGLVLAAGAGLWSLRQERAALQSEAEASLPFKVSQALPAVRSPRGGAGGLLSVRVQLPQERRLSLKVLSEGGVTVRDFGTLKVRAGSGRFHWDGLKQDGSPARPGRYTLQVDFGTGKLERRLLLRQS